MKKLILPLLALPAGFSLAFLAAGMSSYFFVLLPVLAFAFGYFSSWRWGLLNGFLLYAGYTVALSLIWWGAASPNLYYFFPYILAFMSGGFSLLIIGALAPMIRKGLKRPASMAVLSILALVVGWCGYTAIPHYSYYYQMVVQSTEDLNNLELYLPVGTVSGDPYVKLYNQKSTMPGDFTEDFTQEIVDTEQGKMLKINLPDLEKQDVPESRYTANIAFSRGRAFWQKIVPFQLIQLKPKSDITQINSVSSRQFVGPVKSDEGKIIETFNTSVKVTADTPSQIKLTLWNRTDREEALHFTYIYRKSEPYIELVKHDILTNGEWNYLPVQVTSSMEIRGTGD